MGLRRKVQVWIHVPARGEFRVLLLHLNPARGGGWQPVTGGVDEDETLEHAALREAIEETGGAFKGAPRPVGYEFEFDGKWGPARETVFALEAAREFEPRLDPKEHDAFRWVGAAEAPELLRFDSNREGLRRFLAAKGAR